MTDCSICCEKLLKSVICTFCKFESCSSCARRYLLESDTDPHCMSCKKSWSRDFIDDSFPKTFVNKDLKCHRENILIDREKSLLPSTQPLVERELHRRKYNKIIKDLYAERKQLQIELQRVSSNLNNAYNAMYYGTGDDTKKDEKLQFIKKCPVTDCMGYLSSQWKCGICNIWACPDCHEIKGETRDIEHTCLQENIESAALITKETKPCPSCGIRIYKIEGCDQMFCTSCKTPFSWRTGNKIVGGTIHNPHYYEWLRLNGDGHIPRQLGDQLCGGLPSIYTLSALVKKLKHVSSNKSRIDLMYLVHRATTHIQYSEIPRYEYMEETQNSHSDLRVKYMLKELSDASWKSTLQKREKKNNKNLEISQILQMFMDTSSDTFRTIVTCESFNEIERHLEILCSLRTYFNQSFEKISSRYSCVVPYIHCDWKVLTLKK